MCDFHTHGILPPLAEDEYVLDTARVREFIAQTREQIAQADTARAACERLSPVFAELLGEPDWLPAAYQAPAAESGMGGGIGRRRARIHWRRRRRARLGADGCVCDPRTS